MSLESNSDHDYAFPFAACDGAVRSPLASPADLARFFQEFVHGQDDLVAFSDIKGNILYLNHAGRRMLGLPSDVHLEGLRIAQFHPEWACRLICDEAIPQALAEGRWGGETALFTADGREVPCRQTLLAHRDAAGRVVFLSTHARDISEHQRQLRVEQRLREQAARRIEAERKRFFALLNMLPGFVALKDRHYRVRYASQGYIDAFDEPGQRPCHQVQFGSAAACEDCPMERVLHTHKMVEWERQLSDGRAFHIWAFPFSDENGEELLLELGVDVTPRKQLEQLISQASEAERRLIGRDLHDALGQSLSGLGFMIGSLSQRLRAALPDMASTADLIVATIGQAVSHVRMLAQGLDPVGLQDEGLCSALGELAAACRDGDGIDCRFECTDAIAISDFDATHLYRIAQEAVSNAVLHARARAIVIRLAAVGAVAVLTVSDDGEGFDVEGGDHEGLGLRVMRYRSEAVGASLMIDSRPGGGTRVTCRMPLTHESGRT